MKHWIRKNMIRLLFRGEQKENGYVLFFTLLLLVLMAVAATTMISNTIIESSIVRNTSQRTLNFYAAESAAMEAGQLLEDENNPLLLAAFLEDWLNDNVPVTADPDSYLSAITTDWDLGASSGGPYGEAGTLPDTAYTTVQHGIAKSAELGMENDTILYEYTILGRAYEQNSDIVLAMVEAGFLKRH